MTKKNRKNKRAKKNSVPAQEPAALIFSVAVPVQQDEKPIFSDSSADRTPIMTPVTSDNDAEVLRSSNKTRGVLGPARAPTATPTPIPTLSGPDKPGTSHSNPGSAATPLSTAPSPERTLDPRAQAIPSPAAHPVHLHPPAATRVAPKQPSSGLQSSTHRSSHTPSTAEAAGHPNVPSLPEPVGFSTKQKRKWKRKNYNSQNKKSGLDVDSSRPDVISGSDYWTAAPTGSRNKMSGSNEDRAWRGGRNYDQSQNSNQSQNQNQSQSQNRQSGQRRNQGQQDRQSGRGAPSGNAWGNQERASPNAGPPAGEHVPVRGYNAQEVKAELKRGYECAPKPEIYKLTGKDASNARSSGPWGSKPNTMANGRDFFIELRKQVSVLQQGGLPSGG